MYGNYVDHEEHGQAPPAPMYQINQDHLHQQHAVPQQPRQSPSQYYTPPESQYAAQSLSYYQQFPSHYEQATQQPYYYPQCQLSYFEGARQQSLQADGLDGQDYDRNLASQAPYPVQGTMDPRALTFGDQRLSVPPLPEQPHPVHRPYAYPELASSPDPLSTAQYQVQAPGLSARSQSHSHAQEVRPQRRNQHSAHSFAPPQSAPNSSQRIVARVEIPTQQKQSTYKRSELERSPKRRRSNDGEAVPVCEAPVPSTRKPQRHLNQQLVASSPLTELASSQLPPTPEPQVDYQAVLLALADEYITAACNLSTRVACVEASGDLDRTSTEYNSLMSTAMGCLEAAITKHRSADFRSEARLRLRLATLMVQETENDQEAEEILSKGITLCERNRFSDLRYAMHHLLVRVMFKTRPKAALKALDKLVHEVATLKLIQWMYTLRFLRVSLGLKLEDHTETPASLKHLTAISEVAHNFRHIQVKILTGLLETLVHVRSGKPDSLELAQRSLAAVRTHQLGTEMQEMPQARALLDCLDLACCLMHPEPEQLSGKVQQMQDNLDAATRTAGWHKNGSIAIELAPTSNSELERDTCGIMRVVDGNAELTFRWLTKGQLYALGYLLSGIAHLHKTSGNASPEQYFVEGLKLTKHTPDLSPQPFSTAKEALQCTAAIDMTMRVHRIFANCGRYEWVTAKDATQEMRQILLKSGLEIDHFASRMLIYLEALCKHGLGELNAAVDLYSSPSLVFRAGVKTSSAENDLRALATLNSIFILRTPLVDEALKVETLLAELEPYCTSHASKAIKAVYYIIRASLQGPGTAIIKTKQYLQAAVDASKAASNNQLLNICMNIMTATFFANIVGEQAEKSAKAGRSLARKTRDRLWTAVADGMYADVVERGGKVAEANAARKEARDLMSEIPNSLRQSLESG